MKPEILWLFGDSFVDPTKHSTDRFLVYYKRLEQDFIVKNFGVAGSGPEWSLQKFIQEDSLTNNDLKKKIGIVFFASDWARFNLKFFRKPGDQYLSTYRKTPVSLFKQLRKTVANRIIPTEPLNDEQHNKIKIQDFRKSYKQYETFIKRFFNFYVFNGVNNFMLQNMLLVKHFAMNYNRCVYWPIFNPLPPGIKKTYNNKNFYIPDDLLMKFSGIETQEKIIPNHMDEEGHDRVYEILKSKLMD